MFLKQRSNRAFFNSLLGQGNAVAQAAGRRGPRLAVNRRVLSPNMA